MVSSSTVKMIACCPPIREFVLVDYVGQDLLRRQPLDERPHYGLMADRGEMDLVRSLKLKDPRHPEERLNAYHRLRLLTYEIADDYYAIVAPVRLTHL